MRTRATDGLARARELADRLRTDPPADSLGALEVWDELSLELSNVAAVGSLLSNVHPLEAVRDVAERAEQDAMRLLTELSLDRALYDVFAGLDRTDLDAQAGRLLDKVLETFTRSGVDRDDETRARVAAINERVTEIDQEFGRNIRDDVRTIRVTPDRLAGMPADWLAAHPVRRRGPGHRDHRLPRRDPGPDVRPRPRGPARPHRAVPDPRLAAERAAAHRALRPPPRDGDPGRLRRLGVVRRRREDDREGSGDPGVHRPDRRGRRGADAQRPRGAPGALPPRRARRHRHRLRRRALLPGAGAQGAVRRRLAGGAHLLRVRRGCGRACST